MPTAPQTARPDLVLASTSRWRQALLERLHLPFHTVKPECDETEQPGESPADLVQRLAEAKAASVAAQYPNALVIGSDQVAALAGREGTTILTKPGTHERAVAQLHACSNQHVIFHTGLCLLDTRSGKRQTANVTAAIQFRTLNSEEIERYLQTEKPYDCAGSIRSEGYAVTLFESIDTQDPAALIGLPLIALSRMLRQAGVALP